MKKLTTAIIFLLISMTSFSQGLKDLSFGTDNSLEIATWNIERFPKNGQQTMDSIVKIINALDIDVFALQEIDDETSFNSMVNSMPGWSGKHNGEGSLGLAYIYKTNTIPSTYFYKAYDNSSYSREFPRRPFVMEFLFNDEKYVVINNHLKCCGDGNIDLNDDWDEEKRRLDASILLQQFIDSIYYDDKVIVVGDFNDLINEGPTKNAFQNFIDDTSNYRFADMDIANNQNLGWSYPGWPSHLDHVLITNDLFEEFNNDSSKIKTIEIGDYMKGGFHQYDTEISDHQPVALKLYKKKEPKDTTDTNGAFVSFQNGLKKVIEIYPNPISNENLVLNLSRNFSGKVEIFTIEGRLISSQLLNSENKFVPLLSNEGVYLISFTNENGIVSRNKLLIN